MRHMVHCILHERSKVNHKFRSNQKKSLITAKTAEKIRQEAKNCKFMSGFY